MCYFSTFVSMPFAAKPILILLTFSSCLYESNSCVIDSWYNVLFLLPCPSQSTPSFSPWLSLVNAILRKNLIFLVFITENFHFCHLARASLGFLSAGVLCPGCSVVSFRKQGLWGSFGLLINALRLGQVYKKYLGKVLFLSTRPMLESSEKRKPQLRKYLHKIRLQVCPQHIFLVNYCCGSAQLIVDGVTPGKRSWAV